MKYVYVISVIFISAIFPCYAQTWSSRLDNILNQKQLPEKIAVNIFMAERPDFISLRSSFEKERLPAPKRAEKVIKYLQQLARESQAPLLQYIQHLTELFPGQIVSVRTFWISNSITIQASPYIISQLIIQQEAGFSDLDMTQYIFPDPALEATADHMPKTVQKGIKVIQAPVLWNMGYTGRGRKALGCDTGVNFTHPALRSRFYGNIVPLNQAWFAYENPWPVDISSSTHGTHTMGTILGLNKQDGDTIGVAFNAWWMATDPIVSNLSEVKPVSWILASFQWALDPDGIPETSQDIPDVINNSWGLANSNDISHCNSPINSIFEAAEAAGIGVIFSAGNEGPTEGTIGEPANISINEVNVFSVGSVLGHSASLPISGFSSRGPTNCNSNDSTPLWFKPEVVAPGENIWSSIGTNGYGMLSGTSMASPHVSGAFLLLKEAFPNLTGTEILHALYYAATDLGLTGEDNTYGRGIINVEAAYNYLAAEHTPVLPVNTGYDIAIESLNGFSQFVSGNSVMPVVKLKNYGIYEINELTISYGISGYEALEYAWTGSLLPDSVFDLQLPEMNLMPGKNQIVFSVSLLNDVVENEILNNLRYATVTTPVNATFPFYENFETAAMDLNDHQWAINNADSSYTWLADTAGGNPNGVHAAIMPFYRYTLRLKQVDDLLSPVIHLPDTGKIIFTMKHAYQKRNSQFYKDSLQIYLSTDYGQHFNHLLYSAGCADLATIAASSYNTRFMPSLPSHWKTDTFNLSAFAGSDVMIKFSARNDNGNQLYIDDISVSFDTSAVSVKPHQILSPMICIYPNPVKNYLKITTTVPFSGVTDITDCMGRILLRNYHEMDSEFAIDVSMLQNGIYILHLNSDKWTKSFRFVKQ